MWAESVALVAPILAEPQEREIPCKRRTGKDHRQGALSLKPRLEEEIPQLKAPGKFQVLPSSPEAHPLFLGTVHAPSFPHHHPLAL